MPNIMNKINATKSTPLHTVKSYFVWSANKVSAKHTAAVAPTASITEYGSTIAVIVPNINDWANVNSPKNMKFVGDVRRTLSQQANAINETNRTAIATQNSSRWPERKSFVPLWKTHSVINAVDTLNWTYLDRYQR